MTNHEVHRVKNHLDAVGEPLRAMINSDAQMDRCIGLLIAFYMFEIRRVDWSTLCIHADVWDEIQRDMKFSDVVYYKLASFRPYALAHNINALYDLLEASKGSRKGFTSAFLMFKLSLM